MNKPLLISTLLLTAVAILTPQAFSQTPTPSTCPPVYGGGIVCQEAPDFKVDKKMQTPKNGSYVDQIPENETKIAPERTMIFRIQVTNKTNRTLRNINITDTLPSVVEFVKANPTVRQNRQQLTYTINSLEAKKTSTLNIEAKVKAKDGLPEDDTLCVANQVSAKSGLTNEAKDFVTFCIDRNGSGGTSVTPTPSLTTPTFPGQTKGGISQPSPKPTETAETKGGQPVYPAPSTTTSPDTGPELLALIGLLPGGAFGWYLRRKSRVK
ncbi:MAG: DUF11 domain-containing protein [Candidatus Levybacteria bacterium]|nr:DUF11 domain-containing protein [Candidatus Levybacteria bacterium]